MRWDNRQAAWLVAWCELGTWVVNPRLVGLRPLVLPDEDWRECGYSRRRAFLSEGQSAKGQPDVGLNPRYTKPMSCRLAAAQAVPPPPSPPIPVSVSFDATAPRALSGAASPPGGNTLTVWEAWAGFGSGANVSVLETDSSQRSVRAVAASDRQGTVGLEIVNEGEAPVQARITLRLPFGLWSVQAALLDGVVGTKGVYAAQLTAPPRLWRMESLLRADEGETTKTLTVAPGQALFLRWVETGVQAGRARKMVRDASARSDNRVMQDRIAASLEPVDDAIDLLPVLVGQSARDKIVKRVHTALLAAAKAQAIWENWREPALSDRDTAYEVLNEALSEVSCAAYNLVPSQTVMSGSVRVSVLNAGTKSVPLIALGLGGREDGKPQGNLTVFHGLAPGATVSARFAVPAGSSPGDLHGIVQFIVGMGAAVVPAKPELPSSSDDGTNS